MGFLLLVLVVLLLVGALARWNHSRGLGYCPSGGLGLGLGLGPLILLTPLLLGYLPRGFGRTDRRAMGEVPTDHFGIDTEGVESARSVP